MTCYIVTADGHDQLMADSDEELRQMATRIGLPGPHKFEGAPLSHFDVEPAGRSAAIEAGAVVLNAVQYADLVRSRFGGGAARRPQGV